MLIENTKTEEQMDQANQTRNPELEKRETNKAEKTPTGNEKTREEKTERREVEKRKEPKIGEDRELPLPLPDDQPPCACADISGLAVTRLWLSGSTREAADVRLVACGEKADLDVMLGLGPAEVRPVGTVRREVPAVGTVGGEVATVGAVRGDLRPVEEREGNVMGETVEEHIGAVAEEMRTVAETVTRSAGSVELVAGGMVGKEGAVILETTVKGKTENPPANEKAESPQPHVCSANVTAHVPDVTLTTTNVKNAESKESTDSSSIPATPQQTTASSPSSNQSQPKTDAAAPTKLSDREWTSGQDLETPPTLRLTAESSCRPGFLLLRHPLRPDCQHPEPLPLPSSRVRHLMDAFGAGVSRGRRDQAGPAVTGRVKNLSPRAGPLAIDVVACLPLQRGGWNSDEFATRRRPSGQPSAETVARLCRTPVMVVPVGFPGGGREEVEWRLSFSRHEYSVYRAMDWEQRRCLVVLKYCRSAVGGSAAAVKSYYLKTALLWRWETASADSWDISNLYTTILDLLEFLESSISRRELPCYFLRDINLLSSRSPADLAQLSAGVSAMRRRLLSSLLALSSAWAGCDVPLLGDRCLSGDGSAEILRTERRFSRSAPLQPLVRESFNSMLSGLLGAAAGPAPVWSLLTLLFQVVRLSWLGPTLAAEAEKQRRPAVQRQRRPARSPAGSPGSPGSPEGGCGWVESMLLIAQHRGEAAEQGGMDSWLQDNGDIPD